MIPQENKLLDLLSNNDVTFFIPPYQRNYEWSEDQCRVFLEDVIKTTDINVSGGIGEHFFGTVTYFQDETPFGQPNKLVLIDGQQRITTTMLFLVALRDYLDDESLKNFIDNKYLKNNNVSGDTEYKIKLKQVETDWVAYKKIVLSEDMTDKEKDSAVYRNYQYFRSKLKSYEDDYGDVRSLIDKGINRFSIITIELQPQKNAWENPQEIFESMNSLGKPLSLADLVRNYLLLGLDADTQTRLYNKYWLKMEKLLPKNVSGFIRDFMQLCGKRSFPKATDTNHKELYSNFKKMFTDVDAEELLAKLADYSDIYTMVTKGTPTGNKKADVILSDLRRVGVTTAYSFLLELLHEYKECKINDTDLESILESFEIYCFRRRIIGLTQAENKVFPTFVGKIPELEQASDKRFETFEMLASLENRLRLPNDIEMSRYMETMNFYNFSYCKLLLAIMEEKLTKKRPDLTDDKLQIEHIMPQTLNDKWKAYLGEEHEEIHQEFVHNIGNLTLIRHNQELGQKLFDEKKDIYDNHAGLQIARTNITNNEAWNRESIQKRMRWAIGFLLNEVLPIPDKMRKTNNFSVKEGKSLSFQELQLIGLDIDFISDPSIIVHVVSDKEVEFEGKKWRLSPLTRELFTRKGTVNASGSYQGAQYWEYDGIKLADII